MPAECIICMLKITQYTVHPLKHLAIRNVSNILLGKVNEVLFIKGIVYYLLVETLVNP